MGKPTKTARLQLKVSKSRKLLTYSIHGRLGVGHVMNLKNYETCFTNVNFSMQSRLQYISHVQKKGGNYFDATHNGLIISNPI